MKLLFVLTISNADAVAAERLLDFIHHRDGKCGDLLLGLYSDVHDEMKARIRISAGLAFNSVHELDIRPLADPKAPPFAIINSAFTQVSSHVGQNMTWPFLWLEPDCTPTIPKWRQKIWEAYDSQPYPFFGNRMKTNPKDPKTTPEIYFMARVGVYPNNASSMMIANPSMPYEMAASKAVNGKLGVTKLFQSIRINSEADLISVRDDAILVHGDKSGLLMKQVEEAPEPQSEPVRIAVSEAPKVLEPIAPKPARKSKREANGVTV